MGSRKTKLTFQFTSCSADIYTPSSLNKVALVCVFLVLTCDVMTTATPLLSKPGRPALPIICRMADLSLWSRTGGDRKLFPPAKIHSMELTGFTRTSLAITTLTQVFTLIVIYNISWRARSLRVRAVIRFHSMRRVFPASNFSRV